MEKMDEDGNVVLNAKGKPVMVHVTEEKKILNPTNAKTNTNIIQNQTDENILVSSDILLMPLLALLMPLLIPLLILLLILLKGFELNELVNPDKGF